MAYEFKKLADVEVVEQVPEGANMLIEDNGEVKKAPAASGSGGGIFKVTINEVPSNNETTQYTADKSFAEIVTAWEAGNDVIVTGGAVEYGILHAKAIVDTEDYKVAWFSMFAIPELRGETQELFSTLSMVVCKISPDGVNLWYLDYVQR